MSSATIELAELELEDLLAWSAETTPPPHHDPCIDMELVPAEEDASPSEGLLGRGLASVVLDPWLLDLIKRESDLAGRGHVVIDPVYPVQVTRRDDHGRLERLIAAPIGQRQHVGAVIPLGGPVDVPVLFLLRGRPLRDRVRILTDLVRTFRDLVRFGRLPDSVGSETVRGLRSLVGMLRDATAALRIDEAEYAEQSRDGDPAPGGEVAHGSPPVEIHAVLAHDAQVDDTVGARSDTAAPPSPGLTVSEPRASQTAP